MGAIVAKEPLPRELTTFPVIRPDYIQQVLSDGLSMGLHARSFTSVTGTVPLTDAAVDALTTWLEDVPCLMATHRDQSLYVVAAPVVAVRIVFGALLDAATAFQRLIGRPVGFVSQDNHPRKFILGVELVRCADVDWLLRPRGTFVVYRGGGSRLSLDVKTNAVTDACGSVVVATGYVA
jgi:hypothetical protein